MVYVLGMIVFTAILSIEGWESGDDALVYLWPFLAVLGIGTLIFYGLRAGMKFMVRGPIWVGFWIARKFEQ